MKNTAIFPGRTKPRHGQRITIVEEWNGMLARVKSGNTSNAPLKTILMRWAADALYCVVSIAAYGLFILIKSAGYQEPSVVKSINTIGPGNQ